MRALETAGLAVFGAGFGIALGRHSTAEAHHAAVTGYRDYGHDTNRNLDLATGLTILGASSASLLYGPRYIRPFTALGGAFAGALFLSRSLT